MKNSLFLLPRVAVCAIAAVCLPFTAVHADPPTITSDASAEGVVGDPFEYEITTNDPTTVLYGATDLPGGLSRSGPTISGLPTEAGTFSVTVFATNSDGETGSLVVSIKITNPVPVITSGDIVEGRVGNPLSYSITATNAPNSFGAIGLSAIGGLSLDPVSGVISGTPSTSGTFDVAVSASNSAGVGNLEVRFQIAPELSAPSTPTVSIQSPVTGSLIEGDARQITIRAEVTPQPGESIDSVFARWTNPPASADEPQVTVATLEAVSTNPGTGAILYEGTAAIGFNPNDRQIGGGAINLEVGAFQTNAVNATDLGTDSVNFRVKPLVEFLFPDEDDPSEAILIGDIFASARASTNDFDSASARIAGGNIIETVSVAALPANGVVNFAASQIIGVPGEYNVRITVADLAGNETELVRNITISDTLVNPVAEVVSPSPSFVNEVFTGAIFRYTEVEREEVTVDGVGVVGFDITYETDLVSAGQGYFPRNQDDLALLATNENGAVFTVPGTTVANGRVTELPDTWTYFLPIADVGNPLVDLGTPGQAIMDDLTDPGNNSWVRVAAQFFKANAELDSYEIYVNGEDVTPGTGSFPFDVPVLPYPGPGRGAPLPGDYVVVARVTDEQGEVGTSEPVTFRITGFEPIDIELARLGEGPVLQGESVTYLVDVDPMERIERVEFFDSDSDELVGEGALVNIGGRDVYRFTRKYNSPGGFGVYAVATATNGQAATSAAVRVAVEIVNDIVISITEPVNDSYGLVPGQSLAFDATAQATPSIDSVTWLENDVPVSVLNFRPFEYERTFNTEGTFIITARAVDIFGNRTEASREIVVNVSEPTPIESPIWGTLTPSSFGFAGSPVGNLAFPSDPLTDTWAYAVDLDTWIAALGDGRFWSPDYGFVTPLEGDNRIESSVFGPLTFNRLESGSGVVWFNTDFLGWFAKYAGTNFYFSEDLNGFLGTTNDGGLFSFSWDFIRPVAIATFESSTFGTLYTTEDMGGAVYSRSRGLLNP